MKKIKRLVIELIIFAVAILADQLTKSWAVSALKDKEPIPIIKNVVEFYYLPNGNTGAAFGMFKGQQGMFLVIASVVVVVIGYILYNMPFDKKFRILNVLLVLIAAGGVGNMIDRAMQKYVVDFIEPLFVNFAVFNFADCLITVGAFAIVFYVIYDSFKNKENVK